MEGDESSNTEAVDLDKWCARCRKDVEATARFEFSHVDLDSRFGGEKVWDDLPKGKLCMQC